MSRAIQMTGNIRPASREAGGRLSARDRLKTIFDPGTFRELDRLVRHRCTDFGMQKTEIPSDGVITGHGRVNGRPVFAFAQDAAARGGSLGEMHARKICKIMDLALKVGVPFVGLNDSGGARIQEGIDALAGFGEIFFRNMSASGVIPQLSAIMGPTAGGAVYSPAMTDWVFMVEQQASMFITGPAVVKTVTGEIIDQESLGGAEAHCRKSGVSHFAGRSDLEVLSAMRDLLSYLPSNNMEDPPMGPAANDPYALVPELGTLVPDAPSHPYDMKQVIELLVDDGRYLEPHADFAMNMIVCFGRMNGRTVGIIANQPQVLAGCLDMDAADKCARFIRFCDAFNIPLVTLADVPGYLPGSQQEWDGIIRHGAKMLYSYSEATVPKLLVITRKAYGGAYIGMASRHLGTDMAFAWPKAEIAVMGAEGAANIIHRRAIKAAEDPEGFRAEKIREYADLFSSPDRAAERGYVDDVIDPRETRARLIEALEILCTKRENRPARKHGNIPL